MSLITVITAGHLSTCPRMLKAAESLSADGHEVKLVSANYVDWGSVADAELRARLHLPWSVVDFSRTSGNRLRVLSGLRFRACREMGKLLGPEKLSVELLGRATTRILPELVQAATRTHADFVYGGGGALIATALAAKCLGVPYAVDLEDFHGAEHATTEPEGDLSNRLAQSAEDVVFRDAKFLTAASDAIADRYDSSYGRRPLVLNNVFPLPEREPDFAPVRGDGLRLYWFSQTIGTGRGLEDAIQAIGIAGIDCELHLRGNPSKGYLDVLSALAKLKAPKLKLVHHSLQSPDRMVDLCRGYHVGLALELTSPLNRAICLTNKAFTYILAGLAVVFTDTPGQRGLAKDLGQGAFLYAPGNVEELAQGLRLWAENPDSLLVARRAAWAAACRRWHWQHAEEEGALLRTTREALQ